MMSEKAGNKDQSNASTDWMNVVTEFWSPIMDTWATGMTSDSSSANTQKEGEDNSIEGFVQMWLSMINHVGDPLGMQHLKESSQVLPDLLMGFAQSCLRGFRRFQNHVGQWMENNEGAIFTEDSGILKEMLLQGWTDAYEKEFRQFLTLPQIGLGRVYQERVLNAADKHNIFQGAFSKFLHQLYRPMEEAFDQLQQQVAEHAKNDQVEEDPKAYYALWIKTLEGCYMKLFKQPEFSQVLGHTLSALNDFSMAKQAVVNDMLKQNAIPTYEDLDELYKEIHLLKKRMRLYEKQ